MLKITDLLKALSIVCILCNVYPLALFCLLCILQLCTQTRVRIGRQTPPGTERAKIVQDIHNTVLSELEKSNSKKLTIALIAKCIRKHMSQKNQLTDEEDTKQFYYYALWYIRYSKFLGLYPKQAKANTPDELLVYITAFPAFVVDTSCPDAFKIISRILLQPVKPSMTQSKPNPSPFFFKAGYARNLETTLKVHNQNKSLPKAFEWMLQISNAIRFKCRVNQKTLTLLLITLLLVFQPFVSISPLASGIFVLALFFTHSDDEYIELAFGHDIRSPGSHFLTISPDNNHVRYSVGAGLLNILANAAFLTLFYCAGLTNVNILYLIGYYPLVIMTSITLLDRALVLLNRDLGGKHPWLNVRFTDNQNCIFLPKDIGIHMNVPSLVLDLHTCIFNFVDKEVSMPNIKASMSTLVSETVPNFDRCNVTNILAWF